MKDPGLLEGQKETILGECENNVLIKAVSLDQTDSSCGFLENKIPRAEGNADISFSKRKKKYNCKERSDNSTKNRKDGLNPNLTFLNRNIDQPTTQILIEHGTIHTNRKDLNKNEEITTSYMANDLGFIALRNNDVHKNGMINEETCIDLKDEYLSYLGSFFETGTFNCIKDSLGNGKVLYPEETKHHIKSKPGPSGSYIDREKEYHFIESSFIDDLSEEWDNRRQHSHSSSALIRGSSSWQLEKACNTTNHPVHNSSCSASNIQNPLNMEFLITNLKNDMRVTSFVFSEKNDILVSFFSVKSAIDFYKQYNNMVKLKFISVLKNFYFLFFNDKTWCDETYESSSESKKFNGFNSSSFLNDPSHLHSLNKFVDRSNNYSEESSLSLHSQSDLFSMHEPKLSESSNHSCSTISSTFFQEKVSYFSSLSNIYSSTDMKKIKQLSLKKRKEFFFLNCKAFTVGLFTNISAQEIIKNLDEDEITKLLFIFGEDIAYMASIKYGA